MEQNSQKKISVFTDGSSLGNPGPGGWGAVIFFSIDNQVKEIGGYEEGTTNNRMELTAAIEALLAVKDEAAEIVIHTDSSYMINGITKWIRGWESNGWQTKTKEDVLNKDLWQRLDLLLKERKGRLDWKKVKGHSDVLGNLRADAIATGFAEHKGVEFLHGTLEAYEKTLGGSLLTIPEYKSSGKSSKKTGPGYSYLSLIDGKLNIDKTWAECEKRVKGVKGAKYKKSSSAADEQKIINEWRNTI